MDPWLAEQSRRQVDVHEAVTCYAVIQCSVLRLKPHSIFNVYIPGVCATFEMNHLMDRADMVRTVTRTKDYQNFKKGLFAMHAKEALEASKLRIPFCTDMALRSRPLLQKRKIRGYGPDSEQHSLLALRIYVVMLTGICFILRKSEHIGAKDKRPIARTGLTFYDKMGVIPYEEVGPGRPATHVIINIKFSKMDQTGYGRRTSHERQPDSLSEVCILQVLEKWISVTRSKGAKETDALYHIPNLPEFKVEVLHAAMALAAKDAGLPLAHQNPTSHSLRYGGASMMAAASFPQYLIALYGGWVEGSASLKKYTRPTEAMLSLVSAHMAKMAYVNTSQFFIMDAISRAK